MSVWRKVSGSATPIVSLAEAKTQVNAAGYSDDDTFLTSLTLVANDRLDLENGVVGRPLLTQVWQMTCPAPIQSADTPYLRGMPATTGFLIDRAPLQSVTAVEYLSGGVYTTWDASQWVARAASRDATWVRPATGLAWPTVDTDEAAWRITATLGYGDTTDLIPPSLRQAALLMIGHWHLNREAVAIGAPVELPLGVEALIAPHRAGWF